VRGEEKCEERSARREVREEKCEEVNGVRSEVVNEWGEPVLVRLR